MTGVYMTLIRDELRTKQLHEIGKSSDPKTLFASTAKSVFADFQTAISKGDNYLRVKVSKHFLPGRNSTQLTKAYGTSIPDHVTSKYYRLSDFTNDERNIYPKIDISKEIDMMGNYFDQDP